MALNAADFVPAANDSRPMSGAGTASVKGAPTLHTYATNDTLATVEGAGYFDGVSTLVREGDLILVASEIGAADAPKWALYSVTDVTSGVVTIQRKIDDQYAAAVQQDDLATADQVYVVAPFKADVVAVYSVLNAALTGGDSTITVKAPDGTVGTITITQSGSAAGDVDSLTSGLTNTEVEAGETVEIENDATPTAGAATFTVIFRRK